MRWHSRSPAETRALGGALAKAALAGEGGVLALIGPLGSGKTVLAKGVAEGLGLAREAVASPTFVIAHEYATPSGLRLVHADLYRVEGEAELLAAGWLDWLAAGTLVVVEWGDRVPGALPADHLELRLSALAGGAEREVGATAHGPTARALLARVGDRQAARSGEGTAEEREWR